VPDVFHHIPAQLVPAEWQFKEWLSLWGLLIAAGVPLLSALYFIANKHLGGTVQIAIQEANQKQTKDQMEMLKQIGKDFVPAMQSDITGPEIKRIFLDIQQKVSEMHVEVRDIDASRLRHEAASLKLIQMLATEVAVLKAVAHKPDTAA
jgi:hypothetical protein